MSRVSQAVVIAAAALLLSACASSGGMASAVPTTSDAEVQGERILTDAEYVAAVERAARDRRVQVQWVNPPTKRYGQLAASR